MQKNSLPHHLAALWFADIAGYTKRGAEDERGALELVEILQALSRSTVQRHEGRVVKFFGDAVLAEFPGTEMAVRAAAVLSTEYSEQSIKTGRAHDLRIGVHLGDVAVDTDGDLYGDGVNAAARIQAAVDPGQVVVSDDVWRQIRGRQGFRFERLGNRDLKGVGLIDLYAVTLDENPAATSGSTTEARSQHSQQRKQKIRSIAVLPFADLSAERDQEHFSDGVAEEILNAFSRIRGLHVPARTSCFAFRGTSLDAREIGQRLGVETLLDGSIRKSGKRVRISVQLVDASNGYQLWSERFDREIEDIFAIQDEIARSVLESLGLALSEREEFRFLKPSTSNIEAYEAYLRGRKLYHKWTRQSVEFARQMFERAVKIDRTSLPRGQAWPTFMSISFDGDGRHRIWKRPSVQASMRCNSIQIQRRPMFLSAKLSPFNDVLPRRQLHLIGRSKRTQLFSKPIIFTVECCLKAETLRRPLRCLKRRKPRDRTISNRAFCGRRR